MRQNKYDDGFFKKYSEMDRSIKGLSGAGEWQSLKEMLPDFSDKRVLDLGCGYGWHCQYAIDNNARSVVVIDISKKMIEKAKKLTNTNLINYIVMPLEDIDFSDNSFDIVISSLTLHYVESFEDILNKISKMLVSGKTFVFSVEHPIFTAQGLQDWHYDKTGKAVHWPVDNYFNEGLRNASFLGEQVSKYHKTLTTYLNGLIKANFEIISIVEPTPSIEAMNIILKMQKELRRPMMLLVVAKKK